MSSFVYISYHSTAPIHPVVFNVKCLIQFTDTFEEIKMNGKGIYLNWKIIQIQIQNTIKARFSLITGIRNVYFINLIRFILYFILFRMEPSRSRTKPLHPHGIPTTPTHHFPLLYSYFVLSGGVFCVIERHYFFIFMKN